MVNPEFLAALKFRDAAPIWLEAHSRHIGKGTLRDYQQCIRSLSSFFAELELRAIHVGHFEQYQKMRSTGSGGLRQRWIVARES